MLSLDGVRLVVDAADHPWRRAEQAAIEAHWAREQVERPFLFNGTILMHRGLRMEAGGITGISHRVPYAALLHWIATQPDADAWHLFASAVMLSSDGAMMLIRMAAHTANAGKVYAPAGTLDESDIRDGAVDVEGSMRREAMEETGIDLSGSLADRRLLCWRGGRRVALFRRFQLDQPAELLAARIAGHAARDPGSEIQDVVVVRGAHDAGPSMPPHMRAMVAYHFAGPGFQ
tara:strand:+ start:453 stop:1148 length:696 start_codon:yes stop_codon:yes gene_type:complete